MTNYSQEEHGQSNVTIFFNFWALIIYWELVKQGTSNFGMHSEHASAHAW